VGGSRACAAQSAELELKGLKSLDVNVSRMISKLLVKDPRERLTVHKCLASSFFKSMDNTTRMAGSSAAVAKELRSISGAPPRPGGSAWRGADECSAPPVV
jgi:hypothetical protein